MMAIAEEEGEARAEAEAKKTKDKDGENIADKIKVRQDFYLIILSSLSCCKFVLSRCNVASENDLENYSFDFEYI